MNVVTSSAEVKRVEQKAKETLPSLALMESAALKCWCILAKLVKPADSLLVLVGGGNNGADALAIARHAYHGGLTKITVLHTARRFSVEHETQQALLSEYPITQLFLDETDLNTLPTFDWIVDGLTGLGLRGELNESLTEVVNWVNNNKGSVFSVDIPSGLGDQVPVNGPSIHADYTVALGSYTQSHYHSLTRTRCGELTWANPSFSLNLLNSVERVAIVDKEPLSLPPLDRSAYKNSRGSVAIFGSSSAYSGAARLSARAAFAARGGLVSLFCDPEIYEIAAGESPSVMVHPYQGQEITGFDAILAGPGWGEGREGYLKTLLDSSIPLVLDADGIRALSSLVVSGEYEGTSMPMILTPHLGEIRVLGEAVLKKRCFLPTDTPEEFFTQLQTVAQTLGATIVLKSSLIHIAQGDGSVTILEGLNPSLGVAGSGDVLAGVVVALLGQGFSPSDAALLGSKIHLQSGVRAHEELGYYDSESLIGYIGSVVKEAER